MPLWVVVFLLLLFLTQEFGEAGLAQGQRKVILPTKGISFFSFPCLFTFCLIECGFSPHPTPTLKTKN